MKNKEVDSKEFDPKKYKIYTWKNWMMLHWQINPGIAINELILGQRIPKISLVDKTSEKPFVERGFVPCPYCEKLHDGKLWSKQNGTAFKNYFGLYCPECGEVIPCLMNVFSYLILALTYPIWGWFKTDLKQKWLAKQPQRYENLDLSSKKQSLSKKHWIKTGLIFGGMMFIIMSVIYPLIIRNNITWSHLAVSLVIWTIAGLIFGFIMRFILSRKGSQATS